MSSTTSEKRIADESNTKLRRKRRWRSKERQQVDRKLNVCRKERLVLCRMGTVAKEMAMRETWQTRVAVRIYNGVYVLSEKSQA